MVLGASPHWRRCTGPCRIQQQHAYSDTASYRSVDRSICQSNTSQSWTHPMSQEKTTEESMHVLEKERETIEELEPQPRGDRQ